MYFKGHLFLLNVDLRDKLCISNSFVGVFGRSKMNNFFRIFHLTIVYIASYL